MRAREGWAFTALIGCFLAVILSLTVLTGGWAIASAAVGVALGMLSGGLFAVSATGGGGTSPGAA